MKLKPGVNFFGKLHHPAIGIRIPEIFLPGIISAFKKYHTAGGLMLSFGRETSTEEVINAPMGKFPISLGHTGTSIPKYLREARKWARKQAVPVELEADHLIIIGSPERAVKRIEGVWEKRELDPKKLQASFKYNFSAIDEALATARIGCFTTDTSDLFLEEVDKYSAKELEKEFSLAIAESKQKELFSRYEKPFQLKAKQKTFTLKFSREEVKRLYLKYHLSLRANARLYDYIKAKLGSKKFGFEISMDETEYLTSPKDAFFYLMEWTSTGRHFDYFAPNVGFKKRSDYSGSLASLFKRVEKFDAICRYFDGAMLSFHSGSGTTPWSGKGEGVYEVLLKATGSRLKYKISGVYYELLLSLLERGDAGKEGEELYQEIFDKVYEFCKEQIRKQGELSSKLLERQLKRYERDVKSGKCRERDSRADFFRFNSWLALAHRDERGRRIYRKRLVELYQKNFKFQKIVDREVFELTERLILGLKFKNNY